MSMVLFVTSLLVVGIGVAAGLVVAGVIARKVSHVGTSAFWRGPGSAPLLVALFTPWLAVTAAALMWLNDEIAFTTSLLFDVGAGALAGAAAAAAELHYLRSRPRDWRRAHDVATLVTLALSIIYVVMFTPHSAEQFWSFLAAFGIIRFLAYASLLLNLGWGDDRERATRPSTGLPASPSSGEGQSR